jgi:hypothetical protein
MPRSYIRHTIPQKRTRTMSAEARAKISRAARLRWKRIRAAGLKTGKLVAGFKGTPLENETFGITEEDERELITEGVNAVQMFETWLEGRYAQVRNPEAKALLKEVQEVFTKLAT